MRGRRASEESFDWSSVPFKKIGIIALILVLVIAAVCGGIYFWKNRKPEKEVKKEVVQEEKKKMPEQIEGYNVLGEIVIEKIDLDEYILDSTENAAMELAPVKLYGENLNQEGNFCIAGHNYDEIFSKLTELEVGDEFYIVDTEDIIQDYQVTEILEVEPTDLTCLMPVNDKIQVTLITCKEGAIKRLVLKAERVQVEVEN